MKTKNTLEKESNEPKLRVGTLFSGIGAFEEALKQLNIPFDIVFACDNGEIELIPLDSIAERKEYKDYQKRVRSLTDEEKARHKELKEKIAKKIEEYRKQCYAIPEPADRERFVASIYERYEGKKENWMKVAYLANHKLDPARFYTDVRFLNGNDFSGQVDILVGGSPCQSFSTYGKKQGLEDARGTLFYDYARIIKETQPKVFIYENVASLLAPNNVDTWLRMLKVWHSLGYRVKPKVLNAADYDFPQLRKRLFLIGIKKDLYKKVGTYKFPKPTTPLESDHTTFSEDYLEKGPIPNKYYLGKKGFEWITTPEKNQRRSRVNQKIIGCETANQQDNWIGDLRIEHPKPEHLKDETIWKGLWTFDKEIGPEPAVGRKMTPRECLNLMGFNRNFVIPDTVTDKVAYRLAGNSIVVPLLKILYNSLIPYLKNEQ